MPATSTISDNFNDNTIAAIWAGNYGTPSETGGRGRVPCSSGYSAYSTAASYSLDRISARLYPPAANGGAASFNYGGMWFVLDANNRAGIFVDSTTAVATIYFQVVTGGSFNNFASATYNATNHAYGAVVVNGSTLEYYTSANGTTWSSPSTVAAPAWLAALTTGFVLFEAHRDSGTANNYEIDDFNLFFPAAGLPSAAPTSLAVPAAVGTPSTALNLTTAPSGLAVPAALGSPSTAIPSTAPFGIAVPVALGQPSTALPGATPSGLAVPVAVGSPATALNRSAAPNGVAAGAVLGSPATAIPAASPAGLAVGAAVGAPATALNRTAAPSGLAVPVALGQPLGPGVTPTPSGLAIQLALGSPTVSRPGAAPSGIGITVSLGVPSVQVARAAAPSGLAVPVGLGAPRTTEPDSGITPRPNTGATTRPGLGITVRPSTGVTSRP